jgi:hypothetical protein
MSTNTRPGPGHTLIRTGRLSIYEVNEGKHLASGLSFEGAHRQVNRLRVEFPGKRFDLRSEWE